MSSTASRFFEVTALTPAYRQGFRGALVWAIFLLIGLQIDQVGLGIQAGFVGWIVSFCDDSTGASRRFVGAAALTMIAGVATFLATVCSNSILGAVLITAVLGSIASLAAVAGPAGAKKGLVTMFLALFAVGQPGDLSAATELMIASILGGLATMAAMAVMLPFEGSRNPLLTAAKYYSDCSDLIRLLERGAPDIEISQARILVARTSQEAYLDVRYAGLAPRRDRLADYLGRAGNIIKAVVTFYDARAGHGLDVTPTIRKMYGAIADLSEQASEALTAPGLHDIGMREALEAIDAVVSEISSGPADQRVGLAVLRNLRRAVASLLDDSSSGNAIERVNPVVGPSTRERVAVALRYDTSLRRHLLRYVALMCIATALYKWLEIPDGFFITIGINIMLLQDLGGSLSRLRAYALGTIAGSIIGAVMGVTLDSVPIGLTVATFITLFLMISFTRVTWWAFAVGASVFIVAALGLLVEGGFYLGLWRVLDTLIAAVMVSIGMYVLWPTRARKLAPAYIATCLTSIAQYLRIATTSSEEAASDQRWVVIRATCDLNERINEYSREPGNSPALVQDLRGILIDLQQMYGLVTDISKIDQHYSTESQRASAEFTPTRDSVLASLEMLAESFAANDSVGHLPDIVALPAQADHMVMGQEMVSLGVIAQTLSAHTPVVVPKHLPRS